jgi:hypothetical protein
LQPARPPTCVVLASSPVKTCHWTATHSGHSRLPILWFLLSEEKCVHKFKGVGMYEVCYTCIKCGRTVSHNELVGSLHDVGNTAIFCFVVFGVFVICCPVAVRVVTSRGNGLVMQAVSQSQSQSQSHFTTDGQTASLSWRRARFRGL